jgi:transcriptional regulator with XRE-family HTH domain
MQTPGEAGKALAERAKALRLGLAWTRETLAERAGVSSASIKRFETTGEASLKLVLRLALVLGRLEEFSPLFQPPEAATMAELKARFDRPARKRGRH